MNPKVVEKLTSVTAICTFFMVCVLCALVFRDGATWKDVFSVTLGSFVGYYVGRNRSQNEVPK